MYAIKQTRRTKQRKLRFMISLSLSQKKKLWFASSLKIGRMYDASGFYRVDWPIRSQNGIICPEIIAN